VFRGRQSQDADWNLTRDYSSQATRSRFCGSNQPGGVCSSRPFLIHKWMAIHAFIKCSRPRVVAAGERISMFTGDKAKNAD
jgi:hypothetical protein